jgi:hypothetical protein
MATRAAAAIEHLRSQLDPSHANDNSRGGARNIEAEDHPENAQQSGLCERRESVLRARNEHQVQDQRLCQRRAWVDPEQH